MFICGKCGRQTVPHESCNRVVVETRPKIYINLVNKGMGETKHTKEIKSEGWEIVREELQCKTCINKAIDKMMTSIGAVRVNE